MEGTEAYFDMNDRKSSSFIADIGKAKARNDQLREVFFKLWVVQFYIDLLLLAASLVTAIRVIVSLY